MRNIICISALALATAVQAADGPPLGCYQRAYSAEHLAANPAQIVDEISLKIHIQAIYGEIIGDMRVWFADQGRVAGTVNAGRVLDQFLICWGDETRSGCSVECDGGSFQVTKADPNGLTFETDYLLVGETEDCGGAEDLAEILGQPVKYRLNRVDDAVCDGL